MERTGGGDGGALFVRWWAALLMFAAVWGLANTEMGCWRGTGALGGASVGVLPILCRWFRELARWLLDPAIDGEFGATD